MKQNKNPPHLLNRLAAETPERLTLMESWEKIYLCAIKSDEPAIRRRIAEHVKLCDGATSMEAINETLHQVNLEGGYAVALKRVRNAIDQIMTAAA